MGHYTHVSYSTYILVIRRLVLCIHTFVYVGSRYMAFSETPIQFPEYPLQFPIRDWPRVDDPSFIGIFYSR